MINVFIVDDHEIFREGLKRILSSTVDQKVVGEASNAIQCLGQLLSGKLKVDVLLLDISLPGRSGIEILKELRGQGDRPRILVLSMHPEDQYAVRALRAGAAGYITKETAPRILVEAIRKVHAGGRYVSPELAEKIIDYIDVYAGVTAHELLSDREYEVTCLIASGKTVSEIAKQLSLSPKTISTVRTRILKKMGMKTSAELTHYAVVHGLVN